MIRENLIFKYAFVASASLHIAGFGIWHGINFPVSKGAADGAKSDVVTFELGWIKVPSEQSGNIEKDNLAQIEKTSADENILNKKFSPVLPEERGSSGYAKETAGTVTNEYLSKVRRCVEKAKFYPDTARKRMLRGSVLAGFFINREGLPENISIIKSSGYSVFDNAVYEIILRAKPFPSPPNADECYIKTTIVFEL